MKVNLETAKKLLLKGDVVAIPTETVYGLGGHIFSEQGLHKIFSTKERPFFDPLIVHIPNIESAKNLTREWTPIHQILAENCWPGPLTLIAKKNDKINSLITSGLDSVGLRCPNHPLTLQLLLSIEGGIAAPSANKFGKTSPTTAEHVESEFKNEVAVLDGGPCEIGIESTVAEIEDNEVKIYRPGYYTAKMIQELLHSRGVSARVSYSESPVAPGQLKHHYMPKIPLIIVQENFNWNRDRSLIESRLNKKFISPVFWKQATDPRIASRELYECLRKFDKNGHDIILVSKLSYENSEEWMGIWNRLEKAKTLKIP